MLTATTIAVTKALIKISPVALSLLSKPKNVRGLDFVESVKAAYGRAEPCYTQAEGQDGKDFESCF